MVCFIHNIGYRLFCQIGDGMYRSYFHLLVDGFGLSVESPAEDVREADYIVDLVRIIRTAGCHQYVRTGGHGIFVRDFRCRVGESEYDRHRSHASYHVL